MYLLKNMPKIGILIPSTSKGRDWKSFADTYLATIFLSTFLKTTNYVKNKFVFYFGFDFDDKLYFTDKFMYEFDTFLDENYISRQEFETPNDVASYNVTTYFDSIPLTEMWNILFEKAVYDGCDYFFQTGDDIEIQTIGWDEAFVSILQEHNDDGITGPNDLNVTWDKPFLLTQAFVSRKHYEKFKFLFPKEIKNWYCDNWITSVYLNEGKAYFCKEVVCINRGGSERYTIVDSERLCNELISRSNGSREVASSRRSVGSVNELRIGLVITTFNRPELLKETFESLSRADLKGVKILIVDDASTDQETIELIRNFNPPGTIEVEKLIKSVNMGVFHSLQYGWDLLIRERFTLLTNLDSDVIVQPDFISKLVCAYQKSNATILTGYNSKLHLVKRIVDDHLLVKETCGGVNLVFSPSTYVNIVRKCLTDIWFDYRISHSVDEIYVTTPSVIQHIGVVGSNNDPTALFAIDTSADFLPRIPRVIYVTGGDKSLCDRWQSLNPSYKVEAIEWTLTLIYKLGGVYVSNNVEPYTLLFDEKKEFYCMLNSKTAQYRDFIACDPGNMIIKYVLKETENVEDVDSKANELIYSVSKS